MLLDNQATVTELAGRREMNDKRRRVEEEVNTTQKMTRSQVLQAENFYSEVVWRCGSETHLQPGALDSPSENVPPSHKHDSNLLRTQKHSVKRV